MSGNLAPFLNNFTGDSGSGGNQGLVPAPPAGSAAAGDFLSASGAWAVPSGTGGGVTSVGAIDSQTPAANGATISGVILYMQSASGSVPGLLSTGSQTIGGVKKFTSQVQVSVSSNFLSLGSTNPTIYTSAATTATRTFTTPDANSNSIQPLGSATSHQWAQYIDSSGVQHLSQPAFTDISGIAASAQLPTPTTSLIGGVKAINAVASNWINSIDTTGTPALSQPAFSDISGNLNLASQVTGTLAISNGGTGQTTTPTDGKLLIGNTATSGFSLANLSAGSGVTIINGNGTITISASSAGVVTSLAGTANQIAVSASTGSITLSFPTTLVVNGTITSNTQFDLNINQSTGYLARGTLTSTTGSMQQSMLISSTMSPSSGAVSSAAIYGQPIFATPSSQTISIAAVFAASILSSGNAGTLTLATAYYYDGTGTVTGTIGKLWGAYFKQPPTGASTSSGALYADSMSIGSDAVSVTTGKLAISGTFSSAATSNQIALGTTNVTTITTSPTANRTFTIVDAASNSLQPLGSATANQFVTNIDSSGVQHLAQVAASGLSGTISLTSQVSGILPIANGGTNLSSLGTGNQLLGVNAGASALEYKSLATGTSGTDFGIAYATGTITFNIPDAGASARGLVTTGSQTFAGAKTLSSALTITPNTNQLVIGTTNTYTITMVALSASHVFTLPNADSNPIQPLGSATSHQWVQYTGSDGVQHLSQPAFTDISGTAAITQGGTGLTTTPTDGQLLVGKTSTNAYVLATLAAGTGISITNGSGTITVGATGAVPTSFTTNSGTATPSSNVLSITGGATGLTTAGSGNAVSLAGTLAAANGGSGLSTSTAYAPYCGGTLSGATFQQATTGFSNSGYVLTSNGSSALPSWQQPSSLGLVSTAIGTANQVLCNATSGSGQTGNVTFTLANGVSIGSYQSTTPPTGGLLVPGQSAFGTSGTSGTVNIGWIASNSSNRALRITPTISPTLGSFTSQYVYESSPTFSPSGSSTDFSSYFSGTYVSPTITIPTGITWTGAMVAHYASSSFTSNLGSLSAFYGYFYDGGGGWVGAGTLTGIYGAYFNSPAANSGATVRQALFAVNASVGYTGQNLGGTNNLIVAGQTGLATATISASSSPTLQISGTGGSGTSKVVLSGNSLDGSSDTDGIAIGLLHNASGSNKQLFFGLSNLLASSSSNKTIRMLPNSGIIDAIATDTSTVLALTLGNSGAITNVKGSFVGVNDGAPASTLSVVGNAQIGFAGGTSGPSNGLIVNGVVGVLTSAPASNACLTLAINSAQTAAINITGTGPTNANSVALFFGEVQSFTSNTSFCQEIEIDSTINVSTGITLTNYFASRATMTGGSGTGTITNAYMYAVNGVVSGNITTTNFYGFHYDGSHIGTSMTNAYGAYLAAPNAGTNAVALYADNMSIGFTASTPPTNGAFIKGNTVIGSTTQNSSAILSCLSTTQGFLMPTQAIPSLAISTPANGLMSYSTAFTVPFYYNGARWVGVSGLSFLSSLAFAGVAAISYNDGASLPLTQFNTICILIQNLVPSTNGSTFEMQLTTNGGSSYLTTGYTGGATTNVASSSNTWSNTNSTTFITFGALGNSTPTAAMISITNMNYTTPQIRGWVAQGGGFSELNCQQATGAINGFKVFFSSGNISTAVISIYGMIGL